MQNQYILNLRAKGNWGTKPPTLYLNKDFAVLLCLGIANATLELLTRRFFPIKINDVCIQLSHVLIFFVAPSYIIFHSRKKSFLLGLLLFLVIIPTYFMIKKDILHYYFASFFVTSWIIYYLIFRNQASQIKNIFLGQSKWAKNSCLGLVLGLLFCTHLFSVVYLSQTFLPNYIDWPKIFINFFLEANFSLIGMEVLFRYLLFWRLMERNNLSFLLASSISTSLFILPFLANPSFTQNTSVIIGLVYYGLMQGITSCWLVFQTRSLLPSIIFGLVLTIFLSFIF
jgi:hypothetical protein